jgi:hypothetical protein
MKGLYPKYIKNFQLNNKKEKQSFLKNRKIFETKEDI